MVIVCGECRAGFVSWGHYESHDCPAEGDRRDEEREQRREENINRRREEAPAEIITFHPIDFVNTNIIPYTTFRKSKE
jgi:hypothetical protein